MIENEMELLIEFKKQLINFFDELIAQFPQEGDLVVLRLFLSNQIPIKETLDTFNHSINKDDKKLKKMIKERNETFFLENNFFGSNLEKNKVNHFRKLWRSGLLDKEDKNVIWQWVDTFVFLGDKYTNIINK